MVQSSIQPENEIKECFTNIQQVFLLYHWGSLVTLELISLIPLVGSLEENPLAVKLLDNRLFMCPKRDSNLGPIRGFRG